MSKSESDSRKKGKQTRVKWIITIFLLTIAISATISFCSSLLMEASTMAVAFLILLLIVLIGIIFDIIGVAVTSADEKPFHSMAARKVSGAQEAIRLLRKADKVSSICCDVIGDICGVVSGSASAAIVTQILSNFDFSIPQLISLGMSALVAGLTVGGKAIGKGLAIGSSTQIVHLVGKVIWSVSHMFQKKDR
ncbi:MAG: hypothetical protein IJD63_00395 [Oscillospiraceae bacterium]|nr:hypothetical protein [Oscillospiraceae bacterium]